MESNKRLFSLHKGDSSKITDISYAKIIRNNEFYFFKFDKESFVEANEYKLMLNFKGKYSDLKNADPNFFTEKYSVKIAGGQTLAGKRSNRVIPDLNQIKLESNADKYIECKNSQCIKEFNYIEATEYDSISIDCSLKGQVESIRIYHLMNEDKSYFYSPSYWGTECDEQDELLVPKSGEFDIKILKLDPLETSQMEVEICKGAQCDSLEDPNIEDNILKFSRFEEGETERPVVVRNPEESPLDITKVFVNNFNETR